MTPKSAAVEQALIIFESNLVARPARRPSPTSSTNAIGAASGKPRPAIKSVERAPLPEVLKPVAKGKVKR